MEAPKSTPMRGIPLKQQRLWAYSIEREDNLRLKWFKKNEARLEEIANKVYQRQVPETVKEEMEDKMMNYFKEGDKHARAPELEPPLVDPDAVHSIMRPVDKKTRDLLYSSTTPDGRIVYLKERYKLIPEERYYFPETTSFQYGWNMWELIKQLRGSPFARQQVIKESFYRRRGVEKDPEWYKDPAKLSPQVCGII